MPQDDRMPIVLDIIDEWLNRFGEIRYFLLKNTSFISWYFLL